MPPQETPAYQNPSSGNVPPSSSGMMKKVLILVLLAVLLGAGWFYLSMNKKPAPGAQVYEEAPSLSGRREEITIENKGNLGIATTAGGEKFLVDRDGFTLYYNRTDEGQSGTTIRWSCNSRCERNWLPYLVDEQSIALSPSNDPILKNLNTFERSWDSRRQYALQSKLLYRYRGDQTPGDMQGENVAEGWVVARP